MFFVAAADHTAAATVRYSAQNAVEFHSIAHCIVSGIGYRGYGLLLANVDDGSHLFDADVLQQHLPDVSVDADAPLPDLVGRIRFTEIQTGIDCLRVCIGHSPERVFDDAGRVHTHTKL